MYDDNDSKNWRVCVILWAYVIWYHVRFDANQIQNLLEIWIMKMAPKFNLIYVILWTYVFSFLKYFVIYVLHSIFSHVISFVLPNYSKFSTLHKTCHLEFTYPNSRYSFLAERNEIHAKFSESILDMQQKSGLKYMVLEKKITAMREELDVKDAQMHEIVKASQLSDRGNIINLLSWKIP